MELLDEALKGKEMAIAKILTLLERGKGLDYLDYLASIGGKAHIIGITGPPGAGKSTLISSLIERYYTTRKVGVLLIEPSSPISFGSFMGNRIRIQRLYPEGRVFIRSLGSRGDLGGISRDSIMMIEVLDGLGFDPIIVETVGAGQIDTDITSIADTNIIVITPASGDDIQMLKAGIMEIGDIYVINKSDLYNSDVFVISLKNVLGSATSRYSLRPEIVKVSAIKGEGVDELIISIEKHWSFIKDNHRENVERRRRKLIELYLRNLISPLIVDTAKKVGLSSIKDAINSSHNVLKDALCHGKIL
ncbi:methylmalonyl Co-A mutase-associated GTPase MeaB [Sulfolobales archaeon HS-7]|nr:methylmalonyl Co-A mutase-associated GTPase MeaB [Sulfolobales archaeon HS-7]